MMATTIRGCTRNRIRTDVFPSGDLFLNKCPLLSNRTRVIKLLFSSSSSPAKKEPRLSDRNKRDLLILAVGLCGTFGYHLIHRDSNWEKDVWIVQNKLIASSANQNKDSDNNSVGAIANNKELLMLPEGNSFSNHPPPVVLGYIEKVLQQPVSSLRPSSLIVTAHQSGEFFAAQQWYPFEATLMAAASATKPGFVWDARTSIMNLSNRVLEYYITHSNDDDNDNDGPDESIKTKSESDIVTKIWGKYPLIQIEEEDPYVLFWLAMTPLFPAVFLPHCHQHGRAGILKWKNNNNTLFSTNSTANTRKNGQTCASAQLRSDVDGTDTLFLVEFFFGEEDGLLHKIKVTLPSGSDDENQKQQPWQAIYENYDQHMVVADYEDCTEIEDRLRQQQDQKSRPILVPSYIEIGKGEGEQYRPHFKINNKRLNFKR
jgi:hypothetical protein